MKKFISEKPLLSVAILACLGGFFVFGKLVSEVLEGESHSIDTYILLLMRDPRDRDNPWGPLWLHEMMRDFTGLGGVGVLAFITLATVLYLIMIRRYKPAFYSLCAICTGTMFSNLLKIGFDRPRPDLVPHDSIVYTASLPSGHSLISAVVYLTLGALLAEIQPHWRLKIYIMSLAVLITLVVGVSRVYLGVHWPSDVLAGWLAGASWALMFWLIIHYQLFMPRDEKRS